jgi:hypothetical protein
VAWVYIKVLAPLLLDVPVGVTEVVAAMAPPPPPLLLLVAVVDEGLVRLLLFPSTPLLLLLLLLLLGLPLLYCRTRDSDDNDKDDAGGEKFSAPAVFNANVCIIASELPLLLLLLLFLTVDASGLKGLSKNGFLAVMLPFAGVTAVLSVVVAVAEVVVVAAVPIIEVFVLINPNLLSPTSSVDDVPTVVVVPPSTRAVLDDDDDDDDDEEEEDDVRFGTVGVGVKHRVKCIMLLFVLALEGVIMVVEGCDEEVVAVAVEEEDVVETIEEEVEVVEEVDVSLGPAFADITDDCCCCCCCCWR